MTSDNETIGRLIGKAKMRQAEVVGALDDVVEEIVAVILRRKPNILKLLREAGWTAEDAEAHVRTRAIALLDDAPDSEET